MKKKDALETPEDLDEFMSDNPDEIESGETFIGEEEKEDVAASPKGDEAEFPEVEEEIEEGPAAEDMLDVAADVPVQVVAVMGKRSITLKELAALKMGEVVDLNRPANEIVDLVAGGKLIARGELVEIEGKLGVRIVKMVR